MRAQTTIDILEAYDFLKANCGDHHLFHEKWDLKVWLSGMAITGGLYFSRGNKRITSIFFGWPIDAMEEDDKEPTFSKDGSIFYSPFAYSPKKKASFHEDAAESVLEMWPQIEKLVFVERDGPVKSYKVFEMFEGNGAVTAVEPSASTGDV